ncbi:prepilin-type N-terminal cleavage/methylation domain-containing protein [Faecalibacillus intestinalis]
MFIQLATFFLKRAKKLKKKSNKKGFTLVEIIVVLVILTAIAVPSVLGYVNEPKNEKYIQEARSIYSNPN